MAIFKKSPDNFWVKEHWQLSFQSQGPLAYFWLEKRNCNTLDALREIARRYQVPLDQIGFGGLKDKQAVTKQLISLPSGYIRKPFVKITPYIKLKLVGYGQVPLQLGGFAKNEFRIRLKRVSPKEFKRLPMAIAFVSQWGYPNYFGEQRFGSVLGTRQFVVKCLLQGRLEKALKTYLCSFLKMPQQRAILKNWGNWDKIKQFLPRNDASKQAVVNALKKGRDYHQAFKVIPKNIRVMLAFAYQSYLWNKMLSLFIKRHFKHFFIPIALWKLAVFKEINPKAYHLLRQTSLPLVAATKVPSVFKPLWHRVIKEEGLGIKDLQTEFMGIKLFLQAERQPLVVPECLSLKPSGPHDVWLHFFLPPGAYATVLIKVLEGWLKRG